MILQRNAAGERLGYVIAKRCNPTKVAREQPPLHEVIRKQREDDNVGKSGGGNSRKEGDCVGGHALWENQIVLIVDDIGSNCLFSSAIIL